MSMKKVESMSNDKLEKIYRYDDISRTIHLEPIKNPPFTDYANRHSLWNKIKNFITRLFK